MQKYESLKNIIAIVGENELSPADREDYQHAKKLIEFFSQDFSVAEHLTGKPGEYFSREQTLEGIEAILNSKPTDKSSSPAKAEDKAEAKPAASPTTDSKDSPAEAKPNPSTAPSVDPKASPAAESTPAPASNPPA